jgi:fructose-1,6-bisphosphatase/inositol monophosphatase family enzyme
MAESPDPTEFTRALAPALRQAVSIARALEGRVRNRPKQDEATPIKAALTLADTACQEALLVPLAERFPDVCVVAEEDTPTAQRFPQDGDSRVVMDPIDGTLRFFLEGIGPYAVMVGLAHAGIYQAALVALPREELYLSATRGGGARRALGDEADCAVTVEPEGDRVFVSHDLPEPSQAVLREAGWQVSPAAGGAISVAPLVPGVRAGLRLARDSDRISIRGRIGALVSREAGALVRCETGGEFPLEMDAPARALLVAANEEDLAVLQSALAASGAL